MPRDKNTYKDFHVTATATPARMQRLKGYNPRKVWEKCLDESEAISRFVKEHQITDAQEFRFFAAATQAGVSSDLKRWTAEDAQLI